MTLLGSELTLVWLSGYSCYLQWGIVLCNFSSSFFLFLERQVCNSHVSRTRSFRHRCAKGAYGTTTKNAVQSTCAPQVRTLYSLFAWAVHVYPSLRSCTSRSLGHCWAELVPTSVSSFKILFFLTNGRALPIIKIEETRVTA
jgi:hypothetical protein